MRSVLSIDFSTKLAIDWNMNVVGDEKKFQSCDAGLLLLFVWFAIRMFTLAGSDETWWGYKQEEGGAVVCTADDEERDGEVVCRSSGT